MARSGTGADAASLVTATRRALDDLPTDAGVVVWIVDLASLPAGLRRAAPALLSPVDLASWARRPEPQAERFVRRRLVRAVLLAAHTGTAAGDLRPASVCRHCGDPNHGKPHLPDAPIEGAAGVGTAAAVGVEFNTASSDDVFVMAVSRRPVGIDARRASAPEGRAASGPGRFVRRSWPGLEAVVPAPASPVRVWTAGEALAKGLGLGLWAAPGIIEEALMRWTLRWVDPAEDVVVCVATPMPASTMLVLRFADLVAAGPGGSQRAVRSTHDLSGAP